MANLEHILELNNKYKNSYGQLEKILLDILEKGEISQDDINDMENSFEQETEDYNKLNAAQTKYQDKNFQEQLDDLKNNKLDMNIGMNICSTLLAAVSLGYLVQMAVEVPPSL